MQNFLFRLLKDDSGATAIEYAMIASGVALAVVAGISVIADAVAGKYDLINQNLP